LEEQVDCLLDDDRFGNLLGSYSVPSRMLMGENLISVVDLVVKYQRLENTEASSNTWFVSVFSENPTLLGNPALWHLARMFVLARGSAMYAIQQGGASVTAARLPAFVGPQFATTGRSPVLISQAFGSYAFSRAAPNCMVHVPYYEQNLFVPTTPQSEFSYPLYQSIGATFYSPEVNIFNGYMSAGSDFMFAYLIPPPR
jgi:hypothetical protein